MTTHLYCREGGWHPTFRRKRAALHAVACHHCAGTLVTEIPPPRWFQMWTRRPAIAVDTVAAAIDRTAEDELLDARGNHVQRAVLAAHHAETTRRARQAMVDIVRAGYQIGPPPYGYQARRIRVTEPGGHNHRRAVLVPDWHTATVVKQIFHWRADHGPTFAAIATRLNSDPHQYPTPMPNGRWTAVAVRRIVTNIKYTGRQVWARTIAGRPAPMEQWVTSAPKVHESLVDERTFHRTQLSPAQLLPGTADPADASPRPA